MKEPLRSCAAFPAEQRFGGGAVRGGLVTVRFHAGYFSFEQCDPRGQFVLGIGIKNFLRQLAGGIGAGTRQIIVHAKYSFGRRALAVNRSSG